MTETPRLMLLVNGVPDYGAPVEVKADGGIYVTVPRTGVAQIVSYVSPEDYAARFAHMASIDWTKAR